jgi:hypothetical protein
MEHGDPGTPQAGKIVVREGSRIIVPSTELLPVLREQAEHVDHDRPSDEVDGTNRVLPRRSGVEPGSAKVEHRSAANGSRAQNTLPDKIPAAHLDNSYEFWNLHYRNTPYQQCKRNVSSGQNLRKLLILRSNLFHRSGAVFAYENQ